LQIEPQKKRKKKRRRKKRRSMTHQQVQVQTLKQEDVMVEV
jgi:hypothetical protein